MSAGETIGLAVSRRDLLKAASATFLASSYPGLSRADGNRKLPIGMNLAGIADWEPGFPFINLMWGARPWLTRATTGGGPFNSEMNEFLELDDNGYPLELPFKPPAPRRPGYVFTLLPNTLRRGRYVILYDGMGDIGVAGGSRILEAAPGRIVISMTHRGGDLLEELIIRRSQRGNHVRNVRVVPIEHEHADLARNPFRPEVVDFCKPWHCLRFMDLLGTNNSINRAWDRRKRRSFYTQVGVQGDLLGIAGTPLPAWQRSWPSGISIELCIELANLAKSDAWLCVPHLADDEYIRQMAVMAKQQLDPALKVYVEFSNEIWNWQFAQAQWMIRSELAGDLVVERGGSQPWKERRRPARFREGVAEPGDGEGADHPERTAALFRRCFRIWEDVFRGPDRKRLVRVCAVQAGWVDAAKRTLQWVMRHGGCDAFSPTGYFGPDDAVYRRWQEAGASLTPDAVIADMRKMIADERKSAVELASFAKQAGVALAVYEGGQHIQPKDQAVLPYNGALGAVQKHPLMYDLYREHLATFANLDCALFCAFSSVGHQGTRWGSWGHIERYGQDPGEMPKYQALLDANTPRS